MDGVAVFLDYLTVMGSSVLWLRGPTGAISKRLHITGVGYHDEMVPQMVDRPAGTDDHLFMHFHTPVQVFFDGAVRPFPAHTFFLWQPHHRHTFGHPQRPWKHSWIHCHGQAIVVGLTAARIPLNRPLAFKDAYLIERHLKPIHDELKQSVVPDAVILESYLAIWMREIDRESNPAAHEPKMPERLLRTLRFVETHFAEPLTLADLAGQAHLSVSRFSAEFRQHMRASPMEYLLQLRLRQAIHFLRDRNLSVAEVAERTGFNDPFYFSRQFRRHHGHSPLQYRKRSLSPCGRGPT
jgi:AraC-like DNA-binding protein